MQRTFTSEQRSCKNSKNTQAAKVRSAVEERLAVVNHVVKTDDKSDSTEYLQHYCLIPQMLGIDHIVSNEENHHTIENRRFKA
jgi:hypothetical protein